VTDAPSLEFRPARRDEITAVQDLLLACGLPAEDLTPDHLDHFTLCLAPEEELVGAIGLEVRGDSGLLRSLAVSPSQREVGLGGWLVTAAEQHASGLGVAELYLLTTTAARYFGKRGFETIDRTDLPAEISATEEVSRLCPASAVVMRKRL